LLLKLTRRLTNIFGLIAIGIVAKFPSRKVKMRQGGVEGKRGWGQWN
jgi:hypothetical protein